jgi:molybdate transport system substrate-binding protein
MNRLLIALPKTNPLVLPLFLLLFLLMTIFTLLSFSTSAKANKPLRIAVAANFTPVLEKLLPEFTQQTGIKTQLISSATGTLFLQISHGAPFDIFLSADANRPQKLIEQHHAYKQSLQTYAYGQLAFYSNLTLKPQADITSLTQYLREYLENNVTNTQSRFAIANVKTAPYGKAAKEMLEHLNQWQAIKNQLITGVNINQTFMQIRSQSVNAGIVANSQLVLNNLSGIVIPSNYHQAIKQQLVILKNSQQREQAQQLSQYLLSPAVQQLIVSYGYAQPFNKLTKNRQNQEQHHDRQP